MPTLNEGHSIYDFWGNKTQYGCNKCTSKGDCTCNTQPKPECEIPKSCGCPLDLAVECVRWMGSETDLFKPGENLENILKKIETLITSAQFEVNIQNIGEGYGLYAGVTGSNIYQFKSLMPGDSISITQDPESITISVVDSSIEHNNLLGLQGGDPDNNEYYHFTQSQHERLADLVYEDYVVTMSLSPSTGERGLSTPLTLTYNIQSKDDKILEATINQSIGVVTDDVDKGSESVSGGSSVSNKTFTMTVDYERKGDEDTTTHSATYTTYIPQWAGVSDETDFSTYSALGAEAGLQKYVQSSASINKQSSPTDEYVWFISNKNNATIKDTNDFVQTIGTWNDGVSEFYSKSLSLTLADGTTTVTVYLYRSRNTKTLTSFTYKIS